jgi:hypothetical protein
MKGITQAITMYINDEEVVCDKQFEIIENIANNNTVVLKNCYPRNWEWSKDYKSLYYFPEDYSKFELYIGNTLAFYGVVKRSNSMTLNPFQPHFTDLQVIDYKTFLSETKQLDFVITNVSITNAFNRIFNEIEFPATLNLSIGDKGDDYIYRYSTKDKTIADCFNYLCSLTGATWYFDNNGSISKSGLEGSGQKTYVSNCDFELMYKTPTDNYVTEKSHNKQITINAEDSIYVDYFYTTENTNFIRLNLEQQMGGFDYKFLNPYQIQNHLYDIPLGSRAIEIELPTTVSTGNYIYYKKGKLYAFNPTTNTEIDVTPSNNDFKALFKGNRTNNTTMQVVDDENMNVINIDYGQEFFANYNIVDMEYSFNTSDYRNKQNIIADNIKGSNFLFEAFWLDGKSTEFYLSQPVAGVKFAEINDENIKVISQEFKDKGEDYDCYYTQGSNVINLKNANKKGDYLRILYYPDISLKISITEDDEVKRVKDNTGTAGIISRYEKRSDVLLAEEMNKIAQSYLKYKGRGDYTVTIQTYNKELAHLGDKVNLTTNDNLKFLEDEYYVKSITTSYTTNNADNKAYIFRTYTLVNNFNFEYATNYFDNQRAKLIGNIQDGQYINRDIDIIDEVLIQFY